METDFCIYIRVEILTAYNPTGSGRDPTVEWLAGRFICENQWLRRCKVCAGDCRQAYTLKVAQTFCETRIYTRLNICRVQEG